MYVLIDVRYVGSVNFIDGDDGSYIDMFQPHGGNVSRRSSRPFGHPAFFAAKLLVQQLS